MSWRIGRRWARLWTRWVCRAQGGSLNGPLGRVADERIDTDLARLGLDRPALFRPDSVTTRHRWRMSRMLNRRGVNAAEAVKYDWDRIKAADNRCAFCENPKRCERWLDWSGSSADGPLRFCPNATVFDDLRARQARKARS